MNGKHINVAGLKASVIRHKVLCVIMALALLTLMIPSGLRAHAETANDPQPQQEEQTQIDDQTKADETTTGGETEAPSADQSETETTTPVDKESETIQPDDNASIMIYFEVMYEGSPRPDLAKLYLDYRPAESIEVSPYVEITYDKDTVVIKDEGVNHFLYYSDITDGYIPKIGEKGHPWELINGFDYSTLVLHVTDAPETTYQLSATSHAGDVQCDFYDSGRIMMEKSFTTKYAVTYKNKELHYKDSNGKLHILTATTTRPGYTLRNWDVKDNNCVAFFTIEGEYSITLVSDCPEHPDVYCKNFVLDNDEQIKADQVLYASQEPEILNEMLIYYDFSKTRHVVTTGNISKEGYVFKNWDLHFWQEKDITATAWLAPSANITGQVTDGQTNAPVSYAPIVFTADNTFARYMTLSDDQGNFSVEVPVDATGNLVIAKVGYETVVYPIIQPVPEEGLPLGPIPVPTNNWVDVNINPLHEDEHIGFACFAYYGETLIESVATETIATQLPAGTKWSYDDYGIIIASYAVPTTEEEITIVVIPVSYPEYDFHLYTDKDGKEISQEEHIISDDSEPINLFANYVENGRVCDATVSADPALHQGFDYELYINDEVIDEGHDYPYLETQLDAGTSIYLDFDGTLYTYNYLEDYDLEWGYEIIANPILGYEVDYYKVYIDGVEHTLLPGSEIVIKEGTKNVDGVVYYKETGAAEDVLITVGPADYEQHDGFNWTLYADDEIADYGEDEILYVDEASVGTKFVVDEDGYVESYYLDEDGTEWVLELECNPAEGYAFDYYEIYVDGESYKLEPGQEYEVPEVEAIYGTVNYKEVSPSPEPGPKPKPDKGESHAGKSPKTGDAMPFALVGGIAILAMASAGYVLSRKFNK